MELRRLDEFTPFVGQEFEVSWEFGSGRLRLETAGAVRYFGGPVRRDPFRLAFRGPPVGPVCQGIYQPRHPELGEAEVFLVPNGVEQEEVFYRALFN
jgi:hypothetical protein